MRQLTHLIAVVALLLVAAAAASPVTREAFDAYAARFKKHYATAAARETAFANYVANMQRAAVMARRNPLATFGETGLSDREPRRRAPREAAHKPARHHAANDEDASRAMFGGSDLPKKIDWRERNAVLPVGNEGWECGGEDATYPMADVGTSIMFIDGHTKQLVPLSWAEINDCAPSCGCGGCLVTAAGQWLANQSGWATAASYPSLLQACGMRNSSVVLGARVTKFVLGTAGSAEALKKMVVRSPVDVGVDALQWQTYTGGIMTDCGAPGSDDHVAVVVGYDAEHAPPYWILKNSWGVDWGEEGYIRLAMDGNLCGVLDLPFTFEMAPVTA